MLRRLVNGTTYLVTTERGSYAVNLEHLRNTYSGNPRFKAKVIVLKVNGEVRNDDYAFTAVYSFTGHYLNDYDEAKWIVERYEETGNRMIKRTPKP